MSLPSGYTSFCVHQAIKKLYKNHKNKWDGEPLKTMTEKQYSESRFKNPYDFLRYKLETYNNVRSYIFATMANGFENAVYNINDNNISLMREFIIYEEGYSYYFEKQLSGISNNEFVNGESDLFNAFLAKKVNIYTLSILNNIDPFINNWYEAGKLNNQLKFIMSVKQNHQTVNYNKETIMEIYNNLKGRN